jgi:hypothetical protein
MATTPRNLHAALGRPITLDEYIESLRVRPLRFDCVPAADAVRWCHQRRTG